MLLSRDPWATKNSRINVTGMAGAVQNTHRTERGATPNAVPTSKSAMTPTHLTYRRILYLGFPLVLLFLVVSCLRTGPPLDERPPSRISFSVPHGVRGFFNVPRSKGLAPGGTYRIEVPPSGLCAPVPDGGMIFEPSYDDEGHPVPYFFVEDASGRFPPEGAKTIDLMQAPDFLGSGDIYFLGTEAELERVFPKTPGEYRLGLHR